MAPLADTRARAGALARRLGIVRVKEPPIEPEYLEWRKLFDDREHLYAAFADELPDDPDEPVGEEFRGVSEFYKGGGDKYEPKESRIWLYEHTSIPDFRGTCLDVGSADGFWAIVLSEWYHVYGVEPAAGAVDVSNAIKKRLPREIADRIDFFVDDALEVTDRYDVVFCRAPSFLNYPPDGSFDKSLLDHDRSNLRRVFELEDPGTAEQRAREYPPLDPNAAYPYAHDFRWCLERMLACTRKFFIFIISTHSEMHGKYYGNTYVYDPAEIQRVFSDYGEASVRMAGNYIVGEIRDPRVPDPPASKRVSAEASA